MGMLTRLTSRSRDNRRHGSCVSVRLRASCQAKSWRDGESDRQHSRLAAQAAVGCELARKQPGPREWVRLFGMGKLWRAAPRGRERHETRPRSVGAPRRNGELRKGSCSAACAARTVERGKNPEDGTGGGVAFLRPLPAASRPQGREKGHPALWCSKGARTSGEADPWSLKRESSASAGLDR